MCPVHLIILIMKDFEKNISISTYQFHIPIFSSSRGHPKQKVLDNYVFSGMGNDFFSKEQKKHRRLRG